MIIIIKSCMKKVTKSTTARLMYRILDVFVTMSCTLEYMNVYIYYNIINYSVINTINTFLI